MASTPPQNKKSRSVHSDCETMDQDVISDLPGNALDEILSRLPIKDMVRTSVLSTKWRYKWASVPSLAIDGQHQVVSRVVRIMNHILLLHAGPVCKFKVSCRNTIDPDEVYKWICHLSRNPIKELVFHIRNGVFRTPFSLFSCQGLTHLDMRGFSMSLPCAFDGFKNLKELALESDVIVQKDLEALISRSHVLERLTLSDVSPAEHLNICGPNLLFVNIKGRFVDVCFEGPSRLTELCIIANSANDAFKLDNADEFGDLQKLMAGIPQISRIKFGGCLMDYLAAGNIPRELPVPCTNLVCLGIDVLFSRLKDVSTLLCLLRSAPDLKKLRIGSQSEKRRLNLETPATSINELVWDSNGLDPLVMTRLQLIKIHDFTGTKDEMDFVKFMLLASPALKRLYIKLKKKFVADRYLKRKFDFVNKMLSFKRASPKAEIRVLG